MGLSRGQYPWAIPWLAYSRRPWRHIAEQSWAPETEQSWTIEQLNGDWHTDDRQRVVVRGDRVCIGGRDFRVPLSIVDGVVWLAQFQLDSEQSKEHQIIWRDRGKITITWTRPSGASSPSSSSSPRCKNTKTETVAMTRHALCKWTFKRIVPAAPEHFVLQAAAKNHSCKDAPLGMREWPAARLVAEYVQRHKDLFEDCSVIEFGCGIGNLGLLIAGVARRVVITDANLLCLKIAENSVRVNSPVDAYGRSNVEVLPYLFGDPLLDGVPRRFDVVVAADVIYSMEIVEHFWNGVQARLKPGGLVLIGNQTRIAEAADELYSIGTRLGYELTDLCTGCGEFASVVVGSFTPLSLLIGRRPLS